MRVVSAFHCHVCVLWISRKGLAYKACPVSCEISVPQHSLWETVIQLWCWWISSGQVDCQLSSRSLAKGRSPPRCYTEAVWTDLCPASASLFSSPDPPVASMPFALDGRYLVTGWLNPILERQGTLSNSHETSHWSRNLPESRGIWSLSGHSFWFTHAPNAFCFFLPISPRKEKVNVVVDHLDS